MAVRDKIDRIEKEGQVFPPDVRDFLYESLHLPLASSELSISHPFSLSPIFDQSAKTAWGSQVQKLQINLGSESVQVYFCKTHSEHLKIK
ncbi:hypothetical protein OUZ56_012493 [Daphnia magna]|uniref:GMP synthase n=1 Tax=Daphnia magna TaxID=35525 RepID=A0ABQ9Z364_9CRUS|nr:hypothetical protein OUZ56_012493 [Daphnia magna]